MPALLVLGFDIKSAIGISVAQMALSSSFGTYLNHKRTGIYLRIAIPVSIGGATGALCSGTLVKMLSPATLEYAFIGFLIFALWRMLINTTQVNVKPSYAINPAILFAVGLLLGVASISIGVGGSILLVPILVGFFGVDIKKAIPIGLFFVMVASISGLISMSFHAHIDYQSAIIVALAAAVGVYGGIRLLETTSSRQHRLYLILFYIVVITYFIYRVVTNG